MSNLPKAFGLSIKIIGALAITSVIIYIVSGQNEQQKAVASSAFNTLRQSLISLIPSDSASEEIILSESELAELDSSQITLPIMDQDETKKPAISMAKPENQPPALKVQEDEKKFVARPTIRYMPRRWDIRRRILRSELGDSIDVSVDSPDFPKIVPLPEIPKKIEPEEYESELKSLGIEIASGLKSFDELTSLDEIITSAMEIGINRIRIDERQFKKIIEILQNAEELFDLSDLDFNDIQEKSYRFNLLKNLNRKMRIIGIKAGAAPGCDFHAPKLRLNEKLEITGYYQVYDCHPELVKKIMKQIKELPEWKKLVKR